MLKNHFTVTVILMSCLSCLCPVSMYGKDVIDTAEAHALIKLSQEKWYTFPDSSIFLAGEAFKKIDTSVHVDLLSHIYSNLGTAFYLKGNHAGSLNYYFKALHLEEALKDSSHLAGTLNNIGNVYMVQQKFEEAHEYFNASLAIKYKLRDAAGTGHTILSIANLFFSDGNNEAALAHARKALSIFDSLKSREDLVNTYSTLGSIAGALGDPGEALRYFNSALELSKESRDNQNECIISLNIGNVYYNSGAIEKAIQYYENALMLAQEIGFLQGLQGAFEKLHLSYEALNKPEESLQYYKLYIFMRDSLERKENVEALVRNNLEYKFEKERARAAMEQEKKDIQAAEREKRQNLVILAICVLLCGALVIVYLVYRSYRQKQEANLLLEQKNAIINQQNEDITDSIVYAKRIQTALLPDKQLIREALPQSFVLFKPKDIVSGDFYFFEKKEESVFIAAADCTGHGVPGALMSMICSEKLTVAVQEHIEPGEILSLVNRGIKNTLAQTDERGSSKDGMDIAFCAVDVDGRTVRFAGAFNPLWVIRKGTEEIEEFKATRKSIGGFTPADQRFEQSSVQLEAGDTFYIFSDGYADQDGGEKGKKLMTKNFRQVLLENRNLSMEEQEARLGRFADEWKGDREQLDDILVIGVRM